MKTLKIKDLSPKFLNHAFSTDVYAAVEEVLYDVDAIAAKNDYAILEAQFNKIIDSKKLDFLDDHTLIITLLGNKVYKKFKDSYNQ